MDSAGALLDLYGFGVMFVGIALFLLAACVLMAVLARSKSTLPAA